MAPSWSVAQGPVIGGEATRSAAPEVVSIDSWGGFIDWIRAAGRSSEPTEGGDGSTDLQPIWWVGLAPARPPLASRHSQQSRILTRFRERYWRHQPRQ